MKQKHFFILLSGVGIVFVLFWIAVLMLVFTNLRGSFDKAGEPAIVNVTLCDEDASDLCVITFGANNLNRMVIHFQLPRADYPAFYVKSTNRDTVSVYMCEVDEVQADETEVAGTEEVATGVAAPEVVGTEVTGTEEVATDVPEPETVATEVAGTEVVGTEVVEAVPTSAHCTGIRTPLGETIDIEVYTTDGDELIGRGTFLVSAIALSTPIILPSETPTEEIPIEEFPTEEFPTDVPFDQGEPTPDPFSTTTP